MVDVAKWKRVATVSHRYPFPYGFIIGTMAADECNVDCFVITKRELKTGGIVECEPIGLMEQIEDRQPEVMGPRSMTYSRHESVVDLDP